MVGADDAVSREQAARQARVAVHTAKFHLDKLVEEGLLEVEYRRLTGRTGPGSGRPAKLYRRLDRELAVSLPARQYDLLSRILATAVASATTRGSRSPTWPPPWRGRRASASAAQSSRSRSELRPPRRRAGGGRVRAARGRPAARAAQLPVPPGGPGADGAGVRAQPRVRRGRVRRPRLPRRPDERWTPVPTVAASTARQG